MKRSRDTNIVSQLRWRIALALFFTVLVVYRLPAVPSQANGGDNLWYVPSALSLLHEGNLDLDEFRSAVGGMPAAEVWINKMENDPRLIGAGGRTYSYFPIGAALVALPLVAAGELATRGPDNVMHRSLRIAGGAATVFAALSCALVFVVAVALTGSCGTGLTLSLIFAFATPHFTTHHNALWSHNTLLPFVLLALWLIPFREGRHVALAGLPLGIAYVIRPDAASLILPFSGYVLLFHRGAFPRFALAGGAVAAAFALWSLLLFGHPLPPYYQASRLSFAHFAEAAAGGLISPNRGLFVFTPLFLFSVYGGAVAFLRRDRFFLLLSLSVAAHWLIVAGLPHWWAGHSYGARFFAPQLPALTLLLLPAWDDLRRRGRYVRRLALALALLCLAWGLFVQWRGVTDQRVHNWNANPEVDLHPENVWSWRDWQILRGLGRGGFP